MNRQLVLDAQAAFTLMLIELLDNGVLSLMCEGVWRTVTDTWNLA